ncbi:MAG: peptidoglycan bridge formation glycyltransferase FemA/FemB family protein [Anaerolineaceae bacterium]|nr:MAG: peptidoglycan bridge formation glycyltransferase FemA/FemB family protein [Anaerolineaceae bacterium]
MAEVSLNEWNRFLEGHPDAHILQTGEWGELKSAFGWDAVRIVTDDIGVQILFRKLPLGLTIAYAPKPILDGGQWTMDGDFWNEIDSVCKKHRAIFLKIEPDFWEEQKPETWNMELETSPHNIQPPRTINVDIRGTEEEILARMKQKTRYNIRLAEKKGVTVRAWDDIPAFHTMMLVTGGRDKFGVHSLEYYRRAYDLFHPTGMAELLVAEFEGKPLAALMVFARGRRAWYVYGASTDEERNRMPTYLLQWEAMKWARSKGADEYDLWGVPDEDEKTLEANFETRHDGLWGVYRFKRGFGGELKRAEQARDRVYNPLLYRLYLWRVGRGTE